MSEKGFAHIFLIFGIVVLIAIGGWWMYTTDNPPISKVSPPPTHAPSTDVTNNWETYSFNSDVVQFSLKHPKDWDIKENDEDGFPRIELHDFEGVDRTTKNCFDGCSTFVQIQAYKTNDTDTLEEIKNNLVKNTESDIFWIGLEKSEETKVDIEIKEFGNLKGVYQSIKNADYHPQDIFVFLQKTNNQTLIFNASITIFNDNKTKEEYLKTFNQILSTFEFIEQTDKSSSNSENSAFFSQINKNDNIHIVLNESFKNTGLEFKITNSEGRTIGPFRLYSIEEHPDEAFCPQLEVYGDVYWTNDNLFIPDDFGSFSYDWRVTVTTQNKTIEINEPPGVCSSGAS